MKKNVASQIVQCQVTNASDGSPFTGSVTVSVTGDGGTRATGTVGSGAATHKGGGLYSYAPSQAETNYDFVSFQFAGTGAITSAVHFTTSYPQSADAPTASAVAAAVASLTLNSANTWDDVMNALDDPSTIAFAVWDYADGAVVKLAADNAVQASVIHPGVAAVGASTITIVSGLGDDMINGQAIQYQGQVRRVTDYVSATGVATVSPAWSPSITTGDEARVYPWAAVRVEEIADDAISAAALAAAAVTKITDAIKAMAIEGSRTFAQTLRGLWSMGLTKASGFDTGTIVTRDAADTKDRMTIVTGSTGRTSVTVGDLD